VLLAACGGEEDVMATPDATETAGQSDAEPTEGAPAAEDDEDATVNETEQEATPLRVTVLPILDMAPFFYAQEEGLFAEEGLEVEAVSSTGGALGIPAMISGDVDVVFSNTMSIILAASAGLPVKLIAANNANSPDTERDYGAVIVAPGSDISAPADLVGATVAVNTLNNINWVYVRTWLRDEGVDPDEVTLVELPFPQHPTALLEGDVDAVMTVEPFLLGLLDEGAEIIGFPYRSAGELIIANFVTTDALLEQHGDAIKRFERALARAMDAVADPANRDAVIAALEANTGSTTDVIERAILPEFTTKMPAEVMERMGQLMTEEGLIDELPDLDALVHETAR
jgi:NitT/TauT family transport system substrate-binding protein